MVKKPSLADAVRKASKSSPEPELRPIAVKQRIAEATRQQNRLGKRNIAGWFDETVHRQLRILALEEGKTSQDMLAEALNLLFEKYKKNPIA